VDKDGQTIDFLLTARRDANAAKRFLRKALKEPQNPHPRVINVDRNLGLPGRGQSTQRRWHIAPPLSPAPRGVLSYNQRWLKRLGLFNEAENLASVRGPCRIQGRRDHDQTSDRGSDCPMATSST